MAANSALVKHRLLDALDRPPARFVFERVACEQLGFFERVGVIGVFGAPVVMRFPRNACKRGRPRDVAEFRVSGEKGTLLRVSYGVSHEQ